jgi:OOP family OmpA-OmpF porin
MVYTNNKNEMKTKKLLFSVFFMLLTVFSFSQKKNLGTNINTVNHELRAITNANGDRLFFVKEPAFYRKKLDKQEIWMSEKDIAGNWKKSIILPSSINKQKYNAVYWVSEDGKTLLIRGKYEKGSKNHSRGFSIIKENGTDWSEPIPIEVKDYEWMSRGPFTGATMSNDGKVLITYFSMGMNETVNDLWVSVLNDSTMVYGPPAKLNISTDDFDEFSPYLASDNKTMFFASDRPGGFGGVDIWMTKRLDTSWLNWTTPINIGSPFNTDEWDAYFSIGDGGKTAYFSTNKKYSMPGSMGGADIFRADLPEAFRPETPIQSIHDTIILTIIKCDTIYIEMPCDPLDTMALEVLNKEMKKGRILFDYGSSILRDDAYKTLDLIATIMKRLPEMTVELGGHSDSQGSKEGKKKQSEERAESAKSYLISRGVEKTRLFTKGYADKKPIANNNTDYGRQLNRRVEILVISE